MTVRVPKAALLALLSLVLLAGAGGGGYFIGRQSRDLDAIRATARAAGLALGTAEGRQQGSAAVRAEYRRGAAGYLTIFRRGYREGNRKGELSGLKTGREIGTDLGRIQGATEGENSAFEGYRGGWEIGRWYLIEVGSGDAVGSKAKYSIPTRVGPMVYGRDYALCDDGDGICGGSG